jgi:magnesium-protoporphyrin IX monomethyl ester (oxidative) cyclase
VGLRSAKKKILLVRVPEITIASRSQDLRASSVSVLSVPLAIAYLTSTIRKQNLYEVGALDLYPLLYNKIKYCATERDYNGLIALLTNSILSEIENFKPDIVGFSGLFLFQHNIVKELIRNVKDINSHLTIFLGGYPTVFPEIVLQDIPQLDVVFIGEAEKAIQEVLEAAYHGQSFDNINGIAFRKDGHVKINNRFNLVTALNDIPSPEFDLIPMDIYSETLGNSEIPFITSRGCPFSCNYCASHLYNNSQFRKRPIATINNEILKLYTDYNLQTLLIRDENFNVNKKHVMNVLNSIVDLNIPINWLDTNGLHVNSINKTFLDLCKKSGCLRAVLAIESSSPRVLRDVMNKNVDLAHAKAMAKYCHEIDLPLECYFVIGNPGETMDEIRQTISFASELDADKCTFSIATPFPGTNYYKYAVSNNLIETDIESTLGMQYMNVSMHCQEYTAAELKDVQYDANIKINFLENKSLRGEDDSLKAALVKYEKISEQYPFHAMALLLVGHININLGNTEKGEEVFRQVHRMLLDEGTSNAYSKYLEWDTPATNAFRQYIESLPSESLPKPSAQHLT